MRLIWFILVLVFGFTGQSKAQDLLAGTIRIEAISNFTYLVYVDLYTRTSANIDHQQIILNWGDGSTDTLQGTEVPFANDVSLYNYDGLHTYLDTGTYTISVQDSFRIDSILNIPNSANESLYLENVVIIDPVDSFNYSPYLLGLLVDFVIQGEPIVFNPGAFDIEGDSLVYKLLPPSATSSSIPTGMTIDLVTGDIIWDAPQNLGDIVVVGLLIEEWRWGTPNGTAKVGSSITELYFHVMYPTGVGELSTDQKIIVYPNPTTGQIILTNLPQEATRIAIYNALGALIHDVELSDLPAEQTGSGEHEIDLSAFPDGLYLIQLQYGQMTLSKKVIKQ